MSRTSTTTVPTSVHAPADQAAHPSAAEDWWYAVGHLVSDGHEYGYEVQLVASGISQLSITDITAGKYYTQSVTYKPGQFSVSDADLDVRMPDATLSGPGNDIHLTPTPPPGSLNLPPNPPGPRFYNNATRPFPSPHRP